MHKVSKFGTYRAPATKPTNNPVFCFDFYGLALFSSLSIGFAAEFPHLLCPTSTIDINPMRRIKPRSANKNAPSPGRSKVAQ